MSIAANNTLTFNDEQSMILDSAREFCRDKSPITAVRGLLQDERGFDSAVWQQMVDLGWLGLAIIKQIVEGADGTIEAENNESGGAVFTVKLPVHGLA